MNSHPDQHPWGHHGFLPPTAVRGVAGMAPPPFNLGNQLIHQPIHQPPPQQQYMAPQHYPQQPYHPAQQQFVHPNMQNFYGHQQSMRPQVWHGNAFQFPPGQPSSQVYNHKAKKPNNDPFVDSSPSTHRSTSTPLSLPNSAGGPSQGTPRPSPGNDHAVVRKTGAARLAEQIKAGLLEDPDSNRTQNKRGRSKTTTFQHAGGQMVHMYQPPLPVVPAVPTVPQTFVTPDLIPDPPFLNALHRGYRPSLDEVFDHVPFVEVYKNTKPCHWGVIKITNIPYSTTKNEIVAAVGRNARLVSQPTGTPYYAVHIIMERSTGKTMDCYVEVESRNEAVTIVTNFSHRCANGRPPKIGDRSIDVEMSSQEDLMKELFPRARCVTWHGNAPTVYKPTEAFNSGFQGFLTGEEMVMVQKHAETPQRSPFAQRCHNRTYESLISTLHKYPWFAQDYVMIGERNLVFNTTMACLRTLMQSIRKNWNPAALHRQLLHEVVCAALSTAAFHHQQQALVCDFLHHGGFADLLGRVPFMYLGQFGNYWPFEVLSKKAVVSMDVLQYYIHLLHEGTTSPDERRLAMNIPGGTTPSSINPFGHVVVDYGDNKDKLSLRKVAVLEWNLIEAILRSVLFTSGDQDNSDEYEVQGQSQGTAHRQRSVPATQTPVHRIKTQQAAIAYGSV
ncbi:hypothetical protein AAFC00_001519 [Neodothiora populina]|uniref:Uncharacterized protein n=1 Tax=Neodothiora populina TaxID=2781224 RepID=A0ABR3PP65_9PEZI